MKIDIVSDNISFDCCERLYRRCLLNTLIALKPKNCLEIGTHTYQSTSVFSHYFNWHQPEGRVITADISVWNRGEPPPGAHPVMVYPHEFDIENRHGGINIYHSNWKKKIAAGGNSVQINGKIIWDKMEDLDIGAFDFVFLDGDHSHKGFYSDLYISLALTHEDSWLLIDDTFDSRNELFYSYRELAKKNKFYTYNDWKVKPGMSLIQMKDFIL